MALPYAWQRSMHAPNASSTTPPIQHCWRACLVTVFSLGNHRSRRELVTNTAAQLDHRSLSLLPMLCLSFSTEMWVEITLIKNWILPNLLHSEWCRSLSLSFFTHAYRVPYALYSWQPTLTPTRTFNTDLVPAAHELFQRSRGALRQCFQIALVAVLALYFLSYIVFWRQSTKMWI